MASDWASAANDELLRLSAMEHYHLRRNTIVALVDARMAGQTEEVVWQRKDTCSRNTWHRKGGWKSQPLFMEVLANVERIARDWKDGEEMRGLREASRRLALASPVAAGKAIEQLRSEDPNVVLRAAFGILDRAGQETAQKSGGDVVIALSWGDGNDD